MLQIGAGDASKFEFLRLIILLRSSGSDHFCSKNGQKWKVTESFKTCSWDVLCARRVLLSDFKTRQWLLKKIQKKLHFCDFWVIFGRNSHAPMQSRLPLRGASHLLLCKEHRGPNVRSFDVGNVSPKFRILPFLVEKWTNMKSPRKLQNMFLGRPGFSESAPEWF